MGIGPFSHWLEDNGEFDVGVGRASGVSSHTKTEYVYVDKKLPNPDPENFEILNEIRIGKYLMVEAHYPDATNFEGKKLMIYETPNSLKNVKKLDPHFAATGLSPLLRITPTTRGWLLGCLLMKLLHENEQ